MRDNILVITFLVLLFVAGFFIGRESVYYQARQDINKFAGEASKLIKEIEKSQQSDT